MEVRVQYLAALREMTGRSGETIVLNRGSTVRDLLAALVGRYGKAVAEYLLTEGGELRPGFVVLIDGKAASADEVLKPGCVIQLLPPIGGGYRVQGAYRNVRLHA